MPTIKALFSADATGYEAAVGKMRRISEWTAKRIEKDFARVGHGVFGPLQQRLLGIVSMASLGVLSRQTIEWSGKLRDTADNLGINVEMMQRLVNGAGLYGAKLEDISKFIMEMNKAREDALSKPDGKNSAAFKRLGIGTAEIANLSTQEFFNRITSAFKGGVTTQLVNDVQEVGGKSARNLIAAFSAQFANDTPILAEELVDQLDEIGDAFTDLQTRLKVNLAPAIIWVANQLAKIPKVAGSLGTSIGATMGSKNVSMLDSGRYNRLVAGAEKAKSLGMTEPGSTKLGFFTRDAHVPTKEESEFMREFEAMVATAGQVEAETQAEDGKTESAILSGREAARAARRKRENSPPKFLSEEIKQVKAPASRGQGLGMTENQRIGAYGGGPMFALVDVQKQQLAKLASIDKKLDPRHGPSARPRGVKY